MGSNPNGNAQTRVRFPAAPPLNCGTCSECCQGPDRTLKVTPGPYKTKTVAGDLHLATRKDGTCIYLNKGCSIYKNRPEACRAFDCRDYWNHPNVPYRIKLAALKAIVRSL